MRVDVQPTTPLYDARAHSDFTRDDPLDLYPFDGMFKTFPPYDFSMLTTELQDGYNDLCAWNQVSRSGGPFPTPHRSAYFPPITDVVDCPTEEFYREFRNDFLRHHPHLSIRDLCTHRDLPYGLHDATVAFIETLPRVSQMQGRWEYAQAVHG